VLVNCNLKDEKEVKIKKEDWKKQINVYSNLQCIDPMDVARACRTCHVTVKCQRRWKKERNAVPFLAWRFRVK
jgi:hypothetical protein